MKTDQDRTFPITRVLLQETTSRHGTGTPTAMPRLLKISPIPPWAFALTATLFIHPAAAQQTQIRLSTMMPGTEQVQIVDNGDFQQVGTPVGNSFPNPSGWNRFGEMYVASGSNMVAGDQGVVAQGWVSATNPASGYFRSLTLQPATEYVLSAYLWNLGDTTNHVTTVVDLDDAPNEAQLTLYATDPAADQGYFVHGSFTTSTTGTNVNLRCFYDGLAGTGAAPQYYPVAAQWDNIAITRADLFRVPPLITTQPQSQTVVASNNATFTVVASGTPPLSYQWHFNGVNIPGATGSSLVMPNAQCGSAGAYSVVISNEAGSVSSVSASLTVVDTTPPTLSNCPPDRLVWTCSTGVLVSFTPPTATDNCDTNVTMNCVPPSGSFFPLGITVVRCMATDSCDNVANCSFYVAVQEQAPAIMLQPQGLAVALGGAATFSVIVTGAPPFSYQWRFNGQNLPGATGNSYTVNNARPAQEGSYSVVISNSAGVVASASASLQITGLANGPTLGILRSGSTGEIVLTWTADPDLVLEDANDVTGTWNLLAAAASPYAVAPSAARKFYRLRERFQRMTVFLSGPPGSTNGSGAGVLILRGDTLSFSISYSDLAEAATDAYLRFPGTPNVQIDLSAFNGGRFSTSGTLSGTVRLASDHLTALLTGGSSVDIHTASLPDGSLHGPIHTLDLRSADQLSPPIVAKRIHECAQAVHVFGFVPHATVKVYANGTELIGQATPHFGFADIDLTRPLFLSEQITATQTSEGFTSAHSRDPVVVSPYPVLAGGFNKPDVSDDLYDCGRIVPVSDLIESVQVQVFANGSKIGEAAVPGTSTAVVVSPLVAGQSVTARQIACAGFPDKTLQSPLSDPVIVKSAPVPMPSPFVNASSLVVGNDTVTLEGLLVGAHVRVFDKGTKVGEGYATGGANWVPLGSRLTAGSAITADQELCGKISPLSFEGTPTGELPAPQILGPICHNQKYVVIRGTVINATVVILRGSAIVGLGGAGPGDLMLTLNPTVVLSPGDLITAMQFIGLTTSPISIPASVVANLVVPIVEVQGGEPFFLAEGGEEQIDGPVFPRGRGKGPLFTVQACCERGARVDIRGPTGHSVMTFDLEEIFSGYYSGHWDWRWNPGWAVPQGIPVGRYLAVVTTDCGQQEVRKTFYVIFDPKEVSGPVRFSFNETGVWFGTSENAVKALLYHLHPDDTRVFQVALNAANGLTDQLEAAKRIATAEAALFGYNLDNNGNDVLHMLTKVIKAQCADDANVLTAFLRAVGIPAHPATADAAIETGAACFGPDRDCWGFDTWTELLVPTPTGPQWLVLHTHENILDPETRAVFGANHDFAMKSFNDLIVMADETWNLAQASDSSADVTYTRQSCGEPEPPIWSESWIDELCEDGYWNPNHWDCASFRSASTGLSAEWHVDHASVGYGNTLTGIVHIINRSSMARAGDLFVEFVTDSPESKQFPDAVVRSLSTAVLLQPGEARDFLFDLSLPSTLPAGSLPYLRTRLDDDARMAVERLELESRLNVNASIPTRLHIGDFITLNVSVTNRSSQVVHAVMVSVTTPFAVSLLGAASCSIGDLQAGEQRAIALSARILAPIEAGSVRISVDTADGGWSAANLPFSVRDEKTLQVPRAPLLRP